MMLRILFLLLLVCSINPANAQAPLTLEAAMEMALLRDHNLKNQTIRIALADKDMEKLQAQRMPVVTGSGDLRYNPILQTVVIPGEAFGQPGDAPEKVRFGTSFNVLLGLEARYQLLDPAYGINTEINRAQSRLETAGLRRLEQDARLNTAIAYYDLALQEAQMRFAGERLRRARDLQATEQTRAGAGAGLDTDLRKSALEAQNAETALQQARNNVNRSRLQLSRLLGLPAEQIALPAAALLADTVHAGPLPVHTSFDPAQRLEMLEESQRLAINQLQMQLQDKRYRPSLELYGNLSAQHLSDDLAIWQRWFPFAFAGLRTTIPIYDGQLRARNKESYQYQAEINQNNLNQLREELTYAWQSASIDLDNARIQLRYAAQNLETAKAILETDQVRYREGALLYADFRNTEFSLREAENNYLLATQEFLAAQLRWRRVQEKL